MLSNFYFEVIIKFSKKFFYIVGYLGELFVLFWLKLKFYRIIKHRYKNKLGEIDIVATRGDRLIFIEVKTSLKQAIMPLRYRQCQSIIKVAKYFTATNSEFVNHNISFDVCFISLKNGIVYIANAWHE